MNSVTSHFLLPFVVSFILYKIDAPCDGHYLALVPTGILSWWMMAMKVIDLHSHSKPIPRNFIPLPVTGLKMGTWYPSDQNEGRDMGLGPLGKLSSLLKGTIRKGCILCGFFQPLNFPCAIPETTAGSTWPWVLRPHSMEERFREESRKETVMVDLLNYTLITTSDLLSKILNFLIC